MKMTIKRIVAALLSAITVFGLCSCSSGSGENGSKNDDPSDSGNTQGSVMTDIDFTEEFFKDKKIVVYGDSITFGAGTSGKSAVWINKIATKVGANYTNMAQNGAMLTYVAAKRDGRLSGCEFIDDNIARADGYDYAILFFGANDFTHGVPVGTVNEKAEKLADVNSFAQGIRFAVESLKKYNENIKIIFITSIYRDDVKKSSLGFGISAFADLIKEMSGVLQYYYVDVADIFNHENFAEDSIYTADRLHPNDLGQSYLAEHILQAGIKHNVKK